MTFCIFIENYMFLAPLKATNFITPHIKNYTN